MHAYLFVRVHKQMWIQQRLDRERGGEREGGDDWHIRLHQKTRPDPLSFSLTM